MGKMARNEKLKLRAAYFNNIAVALFAGGFVLPAVWVMQHPAAVHDSLSLEAAGYILGGIGAIILSLYVHRTAENVLNDIED